MQYQIGNLFKSVSENKFLKQLIEKGCINTILDFTYQKGWQVAVTIHFQNQHDIHFYRPTKIKPFSGYTFQSEHKHMFTFYVIPPH